MLFPSKILRADVVFSLEDALKKYPDRVVVILGDDSMDAMGFNIFNMETRSPEEIDRFGYNETVFVYSSDKDDLGVPFIQRIITNGGRFVPARQLDPSLFIHLDSIARKSLEDEFVLQKALGFEKWDWGPRRFTNLVQVLSLTSHLPGDFLEVGCYQGSSGGVALRYLRDKKINRRCIFLDVFEGFNYEAAMNSADVVWAGSHVTSGYEQVKARLKSYEDETLGIEVEVLKNNIITEPLPASIEQVSAANIDVDMYEAVLAGLWKVAPLVVTGGIIMVDDAGHTPYLIGARVALTEFLETCTQFQFVPIHMETGQTFLIKL